MHLEAVLAEVEQLLNSKYLSKTEELVFRQCWEGCSYLEIARSYGYHPGYIKDTGYRLWLRLSIASGEKVTKQNFKSVLKRRVLARNASELMEALPNPKFSISRQDWGEAIDVSVFYGRVEELMVLQNWIVHDRCRLITLLGECGIGKTSLSLKLAEKIQEEFKYLIWRSLQDIPPLDELLITLIQFISQHSSAVLPSSTGGKLSHLIELLKKTRCLIILDNFQAVLRHHQSSETYLENYEMYGELLKRVGEITHQSCFLLTSRNKPREVGILEGNCLPVRTLVLNGLDTTAGRDILGSKDFYSSDDDLVQLITHCQGNPLALKMAATSIQELFEGNITQFLT